MYALSVRINRGDVVLAGADDLGVLNASVNCVGKLGSASYPHRENDEAADLFLTVGGLTARDPHEPDEHLNWLSNHPLQIGDVVSVEIVETSTAHAPMSGREAEKMKHDEREYFEHCKRVYLELKEKYGE